MTLNEVIDNFEDLLISFPEGVRSSLEQSAFDGMALLQQRLQEKGKDSEGNDWKPYSDNYLLEKFDAGKFQGFVDFTFTGRMLNDIGLVDQQVNRTQATLKIRPRSAEQVAKMQKNLIFRPGIMKFSRSEIKFMQSTMKKEMIFFIRIKTRLT